MAAPFHFKKFSIHQNLSPFKVGTDAVLLGSWAPVKPNGSFADVGTGTGILTCMLAQRGAGKVVAVESDVMAASIAQDNFNRLNFSCEVSLISSPFEQVHFPEKIDGIICNPPYFLNHTPNLKKEKIAARHADTLLPKRWTGLWNNALKKTGNIALILPVSILPIWEKALDIEGFQPERKLWVKSTAVEQPIRVLGVWNRYTSKTVIEEDMFLYENDKKTRSVEYSKLTKEFYL